MIISGCDSVAMGLRHADLENMGKCCNLSKVRLDDTIEERGYSAAGSASPWHGGGRGFESP